MDTIKILQHNVHHCQTKRGNLIITYKGINIDIMLINSHGNNEGNNIKIAGCNCYMKNSLNELNDKSAILIKKKKHKTQNQRWLHYVLFLSNNRNTNR